MVEYKFNINQRVRILSQDWRGQMVRTNLLGVTKKREPNFGTGTIMYQVRTDEQRVVWFFENELEAVND